MKRLHGVLVRTTTHENVSPMTTASAVPPPQAISELASARWTLGLPRTVMKLAKRQIEDAEAVDHRIGVGQRAEQQHRHRIGTRNASTTNSAPDHSQRTSAPVLRPRRVSRRSPVSSEVSDA